MIAGAIRVQPYKGETNMIIHQISEERTVTNRQFAALMLVISTLIILSYFALYATGVVGPSLYNWWGK